MPTRPAILDARGNRIVREPDPRAMRARYDAAATTDENYRHWQDADHLSARSANSVAVRLKLRTRARYEAANNSYCRGIVATLANDLIGTGPRLQLGTESPAVNAEVEEAWACWCTAISLPQKLRTMRESRAVDGEAFGFLQTNTKLETPVKLDMRLYEADQVATPFPYPLNPLATDGIEFDAEMNPAWYHLLRAHPGDDLRWAFGFEFDRIPAGDVVHWFKHDRPGQYRGIPDLTSALPLFAMLRRYTLAVIRAAETAADFAALLESMMPPEALSEELAPMLNLPIERGMMTTLPSGYKLSQLRAEQPATTYEMFKREILNEITRCLNMPYNIAAGNSSGYNYSSGRLDHQTYYRGLEVDRSDLGAVVMDRLFFAWLAEASLAMPGLVPGRDTSKEEWPHVWLWQGLEHVDPEKEARAAELELKNYGTSFTEQCFRDGVDPEARAKMIAADMKRFKALGIEPPAAWQPPPAPGGSPPPKQQGDGGDNADQQDQQDGAGDGEGDSYQGRLHRNGFH